MKRLTNVGILAGVGASLGYVGALWAVPVPRSALAVANSLDASTRDAFFWFVAVAALVGAGAAVALELSARRAADSAAAHASLTRRIRALRPLCLVWIVPLLLDTTLWMQRPLFFLLLAFGSVVCAVRWLDEADLLPRREIGRASCRERVCSTV